MKGSRARHVAYWAIFLALTATLIYIQKSNVLDNDDDSTVQNTQKDYHNSMNETKSISSTNSPTSETETISAKQLLSNKCTTKNCYVTCSNIRGNEQPGHVAEVFIQHAGYEGLGCSSTSTGLILEFIECSFPSSSIEDGWFVPSSIPQEITIGEIVIKDCSLNYLKGSPFQQFTDLKKLTFEKMNINYLRADAFEGLQSLDTLNILDERNLDLVEPNVLTPLINLGTLMVQRSIRDEAIFKNLTTASENLPIVIADFQYSDIQQIGGDVLKRFTNTEIISLIESSISYIQPGAFQHLTKLRSLYVNRNQLTTLSPNIFNQILSIQLMELSDNPWNCNCSLGWIKNLSSLTYGNPICSTPKENAGKTFQEAQFCTDDTTYPTETMSTEDGAPTAPFSTTEPSTVASTEETISTTSTLATTETIIEENTSTTSTATSIETTEGTPSTSTATSIETTEETPSTSTAASTGTITEENTSTTSTVTSIATTEETTSTTPTATSIETTTEGSTSTTPTATSIETTTEGSTLTTSTTSTSIETTTEDTSITSQTSLPTSTETVTSTTSKPQTIIVECTWETKELYLHTPSSSTTESHSEGNYAYDNQDSFTISYPTWNINFTITEDDDTLIIKTGDTSIWKTLLLTDGEKFKCFVNIGKVYTLDKVSHNIQADMSYTFCLLNTINPRRMRSVAPTRCRTFKTRKEWQNETLFSNGDLWPLTGGIVGTIIMFALLGALVMFMVARCKPMILKSNKIIPVRKEAVRYIAMPFKVHKYPKSTKKNTRKSYSPTKFHYSHVTSMDEGTYIPIPEFEESTSNYDRRTSSASTLSTPSYISVTDISSTSREHVNNVSNAFDKTLPYTLYTIDRH